MENDFLVQLMTKLDTSQTASDINKLQQELEKKNIKLKTVLDTSASKQEIQNFANQLHKVLKNQGIDIDTSKILSSLNQVNKEINNINSRANKIQLSFDTGSYQSKVDSLVARTNQWVDANGNARISTESLQTALNNLGTAYTNLNSSGGNTVANQQALIEAEKALDTEVKKVQSSITTMNSTIAKSSAVDTLRQKYQEFYDKNTAAHQKWGKSLLSAINELAPGAEVSKQRVQELNQQLINTSNAARQAGKLGLSFFDSIREQAKKFTQWVSVASVVTEGMQTLREMKDAVVEVNSAMIELKKVSNASDNEIKNYFDEAAESAKRFGSSVSDMINATADWSRLGYNLPDSKQLAEVATLYKNVGDGIDINSANQSLISTLQGFKLEAKDAMNIIDQFNEVDLLAS